jgi:ABC-type polar amino acid transport system ATPase subunit
VISIKNLVKKYKKHNIINNITLDVSLGEVVGIIGPSGSGKSTILRCINGLEQYDSGSIIIDVEHKYEIGTVFQQFNLFSNMTVLQNLNYPQVKVLGRSQEEADGTSMHMLQKVGLSYIIDRYPTNLSSGQKQRVAIARTLCMKPKIILFDEPTSALDPENVSDILHLIKYIANGKITILIVTHEMKFAKAITDRIIFIEKGQVVEDMDSEVFFYMSNNKRVENFLNKMSFNEDLVVKNIMDE